MIWLRRCDDMNKKECYWCSEKIERFEGVNISWWGKIDNNMPVDNTGNSYQICNGCAEGKGLI